MPATSRRRPIALAAAVATAATLGAAALATFGAATASAAEIPLSGYELSWGIKQSYRTYVATYAAGTFTPAGGASQADGNGVFTFTGGAGGYDSDAHTLDLAFQGSLNIVSAAHGFDITLSDVRFDSGAGEITADVTKSGTTQQDVPLADVTVTREMTDMTTTLTTEAADVLGSASYAGAAGDPVTVVQKTEPTSPGPSAPETSSPAPTDEPTTAEPTDQETTGPGSTPPGTTDPAETPSPTGTATGSPSASPSDTHTPAPAKGEIADGTLGWGVKESFRSYVVGSVANGRITTADGATQAAGNGPFTFTDASGSYDTDADTLSASFAGSVNFKGHEDNGTYGLDLTLSDVRATLDGGKGELTADVTSLGEKTEDVVLADLEAPSADLTAEDDVVAVDDVTATITGAGAKAFAGFYTAGTELDPVDLALALDDDAELPGGSGSGGTSGGSGTGGSGSAGGSGTTGSTTGGTGSTIGGTGSTTGGSLASTGSDLPVGGLGAAAGAAVVAGAAAVAVTRRRRATQE
ncbi:HtaA domain-containing protein [Streptomyces sp. NPDC008150]|uniref:HtaA domain-containing protein n=1 Tax=Streptomyces sp. NPDC008150 TaxID=3364816 RepID=UPI0036ED28F3